jgi:hypothetical protein
MKPEDLPEQWKMPLGLLAMLSIQDKLHEQITKTSMAAARVFSERLLECASNEAGLYLLRDDPLGGISAISVGMHIQEMMVQGEIVLPEPTKQNANPFAFVARGILDFLDEVERVYPEGLTIPPDRLT